MSRRMTKRLDGLLTCLKEPTCLIEYCFFATKIKATDKIGFYFYTLKMQGFVIWRMPMES